MPTSPLLATRLLNFCQAGQCLASRSREYFSNASNERQYWISHRLPWRYELLRAEEA